MKNPLLLFDLGGVVVRFSGADDIRQLLEEPEDRHIIDKKWIDSGLVKALETDAILSWCPRFT
jgi:hypothetical protein